MFTDARDIAAGSTLQADLCIIGAGIAGISIAREFIGRSESVVLLEGGGIVPAVKSNRCRERMRLGNFFDRFQIAAAVRHGEELPRPVRTQGFDRFSLRQRIERFHEFRIARSLHGGAVQLLLDRSQILGDARDAEMKIVHIVAGHFC